MSNPFEKLLEKYFERLMAKEKEKDDSQISEELLLSPTSPRKSRDSRKLSLPFSPVDKIRNIIELKKQVSEFETNFKFAVRMCDQLLEERGIMENSLGRDLEQLEDTERMRESLNMDIEEIENEIYSLRSRINQLEMSEKEMEVLKRGYQRLTEINRSLRTKNEFLEEEVEALKKRVKKNKTLKTLLTRKQSRIDVYSAEKEKLDRENRISLRLKQSGNRLSRRYREMRRKRFRRKKKSSTQPKRRRIVAVKMSEKGRTRIRIRAPNRKKSGMNLHKYAIMKNLQKQGSNNFFTLMNDVTTDLRGLKCALFNVKTATSSILLEFAGEVGDLSKSLPILQDKRGRVFLFRGIDYFEIQKVALHRLGVLKGEEEEEVVAHEINQNDPQTNSSRRMSSIKEEKMGKKESQRKKSMRRMIISNTCRFSKDFEGYIMWKDRSRTRKRSHLFTEIHAPSSQSSKEKRAKYAKNFKVVFLVLSGLNFSLSFYESEEKERLIRRISLEGLKIQRICDRMFRIGDEMGCFGVINSSDSEFWIEHMLFLGRNEGFGF